MEGGVPVVGVIFVGIAKAGLMFVCCVVVPVAIILLSFLPLPDRALIVV